MSKRCVFREIRCSSSKVLFGWVSFVWKRLAARRLHSLSGEPFAFVAASWLHTISWKVFAGMIGVFGRPVQLALAPATSLLYLSRGIGRGRGAVSDDWVTLACLCVRCRCKGEGLMAARVRI